MSPAPTQLSPTTLAPQRAARGDQWFRWGLAAASLFPVFLFATPIVLKLPRYDVSGGQIVARSLISTTVIPAETWGREATIELARRKGTISGTTVPGYMVGRFQSTSGELVIYSDSSREGLLFDTQPPTFITPADAQGLLLARDNGRVATFYTAFSLNASWGYLILFVPLLPLLLVAYFMLWLPPRLTYEVRDEVLTVTAGRRITVFPRTTTQASLTAHPLGVLKLGVKRAGYHCGTFSLPSGEVQALASTDRPPQALLLEKDGQRYYLTPSDPAAVAAWFSAEA